MRSPQAFPTSESTPARTRPRRRTSLRLREGSGPVKVAERPAAASPLHSWQALAGTMFVVSMATCWFAVASTVTAPLVAAGELLTRAARESDRSA
ncbi:MAG: hypothetical protein ABR538_01480 [Candidatus Binatia bacterium]